MPARTKCAQCFARAEGFGHPGEIPTVRNNPMDLEHSRHSSHEGIGPDDIGIIDTIEHGWEDAERQLQLWATRGLTLEQAVQTQLGWTLEKGDVEGNNTAVYLRSICEWLGLPPDTPMSAVLKIPAV